MYVTDFAKNHSVVDVTIPGMVIMMELLNFMISVISASTRSSWLHHKSFSNKVCVNFVRLGFAYVVFTQGRRLNRVDNTHFVVTGNKVVTVVCR